jgi:hypothetical protein
MGDGRVGKWLLGAGWACCIVITVLDVAGLPDAFRDSVRILFTR